MAETQALYEEIVEESIRNQNDPVSTEAPVIHSQALQQLRSTRQILDQAQTQLQQSALEFKKAQDKLDQAIQLVEQLAGCQIQQRVKK
jgi:signal transduction histidine kinase